MITSRSRDLLTLTLASDIKVSLVADFCADFLIFDDSHARLVNWIKIFRHLELLIFTSLVIVQCYGVLVRIRASL